MQGDNFEQKSTSKAKMAEFRAQMMSDFACPVVEPSLLCIELSQAARNYELKNLHFSMIPSFNGMTEEDPLSFIRDFYSTVQEFLLGVLSEEQLRMK